jgi:hypothetical protein
MVGSKNRGFLLSHHRSSTGHPSSSLIDPSHLMLSIQTFQFQLSAVPRDKKRRQNLLTKKANERLNKYLVPAGMTTYVKRPTQGDKKRSITKKDP